MPSLVLSSDPNLKLNEARFECLGKRTKFIYAGNYLCYYTPGDEEIKVFCLLDSKVKTIHLSKYFESPNDVGVSIDAG